MRELATSQVVSDRLAFAVRGSRSEQPLPHGHPRQHKSILQVDELGVVLGTRTRSRWLERRGNGFTFLGQVVEAVDVIKAVILTRQRQILPFLRPERDQGPYGFRISRMDGEKLTPDEAHTTRRIETMLLNGGDEADPIQRQGRAPGVAPLQILEMTRKQVSEQADFRLVDAMSPGKSRPCGCRCLRQAVVLSLPFDRTVPTPDTAIAPDLFYNAAAAHRHALGPPHFAPSPAVPQRRRAS